MNIVLSKSDKQSKKTAVITNKKTIYFGQAGASDYTIHKDAKRKELYLKMHANREKWGRSINSSFL